MAQITWRNVNAPSFAGSNQAAQAGSESISRGLASLGTLAQQEGKRRKDVNTGELLREIQGLDTAGLTEARSSGQFGADALEGQNVDEGALFAALKGQDAAIAKQATDVFNRENATRTQSDAPILAASQAELAGISDPKQIAAYTAKLGESGLSSQAQTQMLNAAKAAETSLVNKGRSEETYIRSQAALAREDKARLAVEKGEAGVNTALSGNTTINTANRAIGAQVAKEFGLEVDASGIPIIGETELPVLPDNPTPAQQDEYDFAVAVAENTGVDAVAQRMVELGLKDQPTDAQNEASLLSSMKKAKPTERSAALKLYRSTKAEFDKLPEATQIGVARSIEQVNQTIDTNLRQAREAHQTLVASNPTTPEETARQKSVTLNKVLSLAVEKAPEGSYWFNMFGPSKGVGGKTLQKLITDTANEKFDGNSVEPWMLETALLATVQSPEEAMTPEVAEDSFRKLVKLMATDPTGKGRMILINKSKTKLAEAELAAPLAKNREASNITKSARRGAGKATFSDMFKRGTESSLYSGN